MLKKKTNYINRKNVRLRSELWVFSSSKIRGEADNAAGERYYLLSNLSACITADMISGWPRPPRSVRDETANLSSPPPSSVWSLRRIYRVDNHSEEQRLTTLQAGSTCQSCHTSRRLWCLNGSGLHQSPLTCPPPPNGSGGGGDGGR